MPRMDVIWVVIGIVVIDFVIEWKAWSEVEFGDDGWGRPVKIII